MNITNLDVKVPQNVKTSTKDVKLPTVNVKTTTKALNTTKKDEKPKEKVGEEPTIAASFGPIQVSKSVIFNAWVESLMPHCLKDEEQSVAGIPWEKIKIDAMKDDY